MLLGIKTQWQRIFFYSFFFFFSVFMCNHRPTKKQKKEKIGKPISLKLLITWQTTIANFSNPFFFFFLLLFVFLFFYYFFFPLSSVFFHFFLAFYFNFCFFEQVTPLTNYEDLRETTSSTFRVYTASSCNFLIRVLCAQDFTRCPELVRQNGQNVRFEPNLYRHYMERRR